MSKLPEPKKGDIIPIDVRIADVTKIPPKFFVHDEVLAALQRVIRTEVVVRGNPVPPGVEAVHVPYTVSAARQRMAVANSDLVHQLKRSAPGLIMLWLTLIVIIAAVAIAWRYISA